MFFFQQMVLLKSAQSDSAKFLKYDSYQVSLFITIRAVPGLTFPNPARSGFSPISNLKSSLNQSWIWQLHIDINGVYTEDIVWL